MSTYKKVVQYNALEQGFHVSNNNRIKDPAKYNLLVPEDVSANYHGEGPIVLAVTNVISIVFT